MGGKKKPTLSQLEKRTKKREGRGEREERKGKYEMRLTSEGTLSELSVEQVVNGIKKMPYVTPHVLYSKFGIKISRAKRVLRELESRGILVAVDKNRRCPIYVLAK